MKARGRLALVAIGVAAIWVSLILMIAGMWRIAVVLWILYVVCVAVLWFWPRRVAHLDDGLDW